MARGINLGQALSAIGSLGTRNKEERQRKEREDIENENRSRARASAQLRTIGTVAGTAVGAVYGAPGAGAAAGSALGGMISANQGNEEINPQEIVGAAQAVGGAYQNYGNKDAIRNRRLSYGENEVSSAAPNTTNALSNLKQEQNSFFMQAERSGNYTKTPTLIAAEAKANTNTPIVRAYLELIKKKESLSPDDKNYEKKIDRYKLEYQQEANRIAKTEFYNQSKSNRSGDEIIQGLEQKLPDLAKYIPPEMVQKANLTYAEMNATELQQDYNLEVADIAASEKSAEKRIADILGLRKQKKYKGNLKNVNSNFALNTVQSIRKQEVADKKQTALVQRQEVKDAAVLARHNKEMVLRWEVAESDYAVKLNKMRSEAVKELTTTDNLKNEIKPTSLAVDKKMRDKLKTLSETTKEGRHKEVAKKAFALYDKKVKDTIKARTNVILNTINTTDNILEIDTAIKKHGAGGAPKDINEAEVIKALKKRKKILLAKKEGSSLKRQAQASKVKQPGDNLVPELIAENTEEVSGDGRSFLNKPIAETFRDTEVPENILHTQIKDLFG